MKIPAQITAGDTVTWTDDPPVLADGTSATADAYALSYAIRGGASGVDPVTTASGNGWSTTISSAQSAAMNAAAAPVTWYWQAYATKTADSSRVTVGTGQIIVKPNLSALSGTYDGRTLAEQNLAAVEAEIQARIAGHVVAEYSIGDRSLKREPMSELITLRSQLRLQVAREKTAAAVANGLGNPAYAFTRFR